MYIVITNGSNKFKTGLNTGDDLYMIDINRVYHPIKTFRISLVNYDDEITYREGILANQIDPHRIYVNKMFLSEEYQFTDIDSIHKFNIKINKRFLECVCYVGNIKTLDYLKNTNQIPKYDGTELYYASCAGKTEVLDWWEQNGLEFVFNKYEDVITGASYNSQLNVLQWWESRRSKFMMYNCDHFNVYDKSHRYPLMFSFYTIFRDALRTGNISVLEWIKNSKYDLDIPKDPSDPDRFPVHIALYHNNINVLDWLVKSGLPFQYDKNILQDPRFRIVCNHETIQWWNDNIKNAQIQNSIIYNKASYVNTLKKCCIS
jgi:hypothetical protein